MMAVFAAIKCSWRCAGAFAGQESLTMSENCFKQARLGKHTAGICELCLCDCQHVFVLYFLAFFFLLSLLCNKAVKV